MRLHNLDYRLNEQSYRLAYWTAGNQQASRILICVHGLLRHSRDFDELVQRFEHSHWILIPDLPGRGLSEWFSDPTDYQLESYVWVMRQLMQRYPERPVDWVGTSLGGLIGMAIAGGPGSAAEKRIERLVLNDIGAELPGEALQRIADYIDAPEFRSLDEVRSYLIGRYQSYQGLSDETWDRLARYGSRRSDAGTFQLHYDPGIALNAKGLAADTIPLWDLWAQIKQPVFLAHGLTSDLLTPSIVERMREEHPQLAYLPIPGVGHAPSLMVSDQLDPLARWLDESIK